MNTGCPLPNRIHGCAKLDQSTLDTRIPSSSTVPSLSDGFCFPLENMCKIKHILHFIKILKYLWITLHPQKYFTLKYNLGIELYCKSDSPKNSLGRKVLKMALVLAALNCCSVLSTIILPCLLSKKM